jgi:magnesium-transporting ATPase (P-type)
MNKHVLFVIAFAVVIIAILVNVYQISTISGFDFIKISQLYITLGFLLLLLILLIFVYVDYLLLKKKI